MAGGRPSGPNGDIAASDGMQAKPWRDPVSERRREHHHNPEAFASRSAGGGGSTSAALAVGRRTGAGAAGPARAPATLTWPA